MAATATAIRANLGMTTTNYQDILGTVGAYLDEHGLSNIRLLETSQGFVLEGIRCTNGNGGGKTRERLVLTTQQITELMLWR